MAVFLHNTGIVISFLKEEEFELGISLAKKILSHFYRNPFLQKDFPWIKIVLILDDVNVYKVIYWIKKYYCVYLSKFGLNFIN